MSDPLETAFDDFADATQTSLSRMADELRSFRGEIERMREEQRSSPAVTAPAEVREGLPGKDGKDGAPGKDATVNVEEIVARVADLAVPRIVQLIPAPVKGDPGPAGKDGEKGERGENGLSSPEEIRAFVAEERALQWREFYLGVFRPDNDYKRGQAVTWNGSMWIAIEDTRSMPDTDKSWLLAVKHGRDASHGRK